MRGGGTDSETSVIHVEIKMLPPTPYNRWIHRKIISSIGEMNSRMERLSQEARHQRIAGKVGMMGP